MENKGPVTIDQAIARLQQIRGASRLGGNTVVVISAQWIETSQVDEIVLAQDSDGAVVEFVSRNHP